MPVSVVLPNVPTRPGPNGITFVVLDNDWKAGLVVTDGEHGQEVQPLDTCLMDGGCVGDWVGGSPFSHGSTVVRGRWWSRSTK